MNKLLLAAAVGALALPATAFAIPGGGPTPAAGPPVTGNVDINGYVQARCLFTTASATITLNELSNTDGTLNTGLVNSGTATLVGWCNGSTSTMSVVSNPILMTTAHPAPPSGFTDRVDFTGTATANAVSASDSTLAAPSAPAAVGIFSDNIVVSLSAAAATGKMIAGPYQGSVVVTLTPGY